MIVVDAFEQDVVRQSRLAVHLGRQAILRVEEHRMLAVRPRRAGHRDEGRLEVPVAQRYLLEQLALDDASGVGAIGLQERRLADDGNCLGHRADFELQVDAQRGVDLDDRLVAHGLLEAGQLGGDAVQAVLDAREHVVAVLVCDRRRADVCVDFGDCDGRAGDREAGRIGHVPEQRPGDGLSVKRRAEDQQHPKHQRSQRQDANERAPKETIHLHPPREITLHDGCDLFKGRVFSGQTNLRM